MKRALAVLLALVGFAAFGQLTFTGKWTGNYCIDGTLTSTLSLSTTLGCFDITGNLGFGAGGITDVNFATKGTLGPLTISGAMYFDPALVKYKFSNLSTSLDFAGMSVGLAVYHTDMYQTYYNQFTTVYYPTTIPCQTQSDPGKGWGMLYDMSLKVAPCAVDLYFVDCCQGIEFYQALLTIEGVGLCCGISLDVEASFLKEKGFDYVEFSGINIPLCCGVSLDVIVDFTVDSKTVTVKPKFAGIADGCFTVWGNAVYANNIWGGIEIYGYDIKCTIADCNYFEIINAFNVSEVNKKLATADKFSSTCGEFELFKLGFCGAGCCGGQYSAALRIFFGKNGGIFDITRLVYSFSVPIMSNFTLNISGTAAAASCASNSFCFGWTFTF